MISRQRARIIAIMNKLQQQADTGEIAEGIEQDPALAEHLLHHINSPANGLPQQLSSIAEALAELGHAALYRWLSLLLFCPEIHPGQHNNTLLENALVRARLTELLGQRKLPTQERAGLFVTGMLSSLDKLFDMPMDRALSHFSLSVPMGQALTRGEGTYSPFLKLAIACEEHDQPGIGHYARMTGISTEQINMLYAKAQVWALEIER